VANVDDQSLPGGNEYSQMLHECVMKEEGEMLVVCGAIEAQIGELDNPKERKMFLMEYGLKQSGLDRLIRATYAHLNLITYFTAGPKEVRAWTIPQGLKAPQAAGVIHSDFENGFIKAEVIKMQDFEHFGNEIACKEAGRMFVEGKEYVVKDGDIVHFRFNV